MYYLWSIISHANLPAQNNRNYLSHKFVSVKNPGMDWVGNSGSESHNITWPALHSSLDSTEAGESTSKLSHMVGGRIQIPVDHWIVASLSSRPHGPLQEVAHSMVASLHQNEQMREQ